MTTNAQIKPEDIKQVYSGKAGRCCCGCSGNHRTDAVSIKRLVNKINKAIAADPYSVDRDSTYIAVETATRIHIAYFADKAPAPVTEPAPFFIPPFVN